MPGSAFVVLLAASVVATSEAASQVTPAPQTDSARIALQARVRQRIAAVVKQRLKLSDDQMRQLTAVNATYEERRRPIIAQERDARVAIRAQLQRGDQADQKQVESALADLFRAQHSRIDLAEQEQRDLANFLQPSQRAGYLALQEQVRRRIEQMRHGDGGAGRGPRAGAGAQGQAPPR